MGTQTCWSSIFIGHEGLTVHMYMIYHFYIFLCRLQATFWASEDMADGISVRD
jgi:hypothetical protein